MKSSLIIILLVLAKITSAQEYEYTIDIMPSVAFSSPILPTHIDSTHYYTSNEIHDMAKPERGWSDFYDQLSALAYPADAKKLKIEAYFSVYYKINEKGELETVYVGAEYGKSVSECVSCEALILKFIKETKWLPGKINGTPVKTKSDLPIEFTIEKKY